MQLPLLLAGPILRRVDPGLVAVQVVLSEKASVRLTVWEGRVAADTSNPPFASSHPAPTPPGGTPDPLALPVPATPAPDPTEPLPHPGESTVRIGDRLHLGLVTARLPPASGKVFQSDRNYSYNVTIKTSGGTKDLSTLGLLLPHAESGVQAEPLGYADRMLPSFALPPTVLDDLRIAYGSCRRPGYDDGDALAWLDEYLSERVDDPRGRIHQLFMGGDQIYADDVDAVLMQRVVELGVELIGTAGGVPLERVKVGKILHRPETSKADPADPTKVYEAEPPELTKAKGDLPAGPPQFPVGGRNDLTTVNGRLDLAQRSGQLTGVDGVNQLISLGEFAATYLLVWSPACWGDEVPGVQLVTTGMPSGTPLHWLDKLTDDQDVLLPPLDFPVRVPEHLYVDADTIQERLEEEAEKRTDDDRVRARRASHRVHREFLLGLARARRVLANTPTYMMLDDHDVTDDFFLNPMWRRRVLGSALGQVVLTNGMLAYALFQDWGNDPRRYDTVTTPERPELGGQLPGDLLDTAARLFPPGKQGPDKDAFEAVGRMFGHHLDNQPLPDGRYAAVKPPISWHFRVDGPKHVVVALDNRTRRSFVAEIGPPGNVAPEALVDQIPVPPLPAGREVLVVLAPLQVIGPPVIDEVVARAIYRVFDLVAMSELTSSTSASGNRLMPGTNPDALETWAFDAATFEHLLSRLADHGRVVLLSGDVHNSASNAMSYWRGTSTRPARIAQFTSSGFKNVMPVYLRALDQSAMLLQELLRAKLGVERLGWARPSPEMVLLPRGKTEADLVATTRAKLLRSPVLLPLHGWPDDNPEGEEPVDELRSRLNPANPPEWRWKITPLLDLRPDAERPAPIRAKPLDDALIEQQLADPATAFPAMQAVAGRHQAALGRMRNARQMLFRSNFGICRFESVGSTVTAVGEVWTSAVDPETQLQVLDAYMVHRAPLGPLFEAPPKDLREAVLSRVPIPPPPDPPPEPSPEPEPEPGP